MYNDILLPLTRWCEIDLDSIKYNLNDKKFKTAFSLKARVSLIKEIPQHSFVSYGLNYQSDSTQEITDHINARVPRVYKEAGEAFI